MTEKDKVHIFVDYSNILLGAQDRISPTVNDLDGFPQKVSITKKINVEKLSSLILHGRQKM